MPIVQQTEQDAAVPPQTMLPPAPPRHRRGKRRARPLLDHCLNCDRATGPEDNFCPNCGQENADDTIHLKPLITDALSEIASWDSKLVRTVLPLLFRPGFLTNEFLAGRRVRYLSPLKMYLVISALFFLVPSIAQMGKSIELGHGGIRIQTDPPKHVAGDTRPKRTAANTGGHGGVVQVDEGDVWVNTLPKTVAAYDAHQRDPHNAHRDGFWKALLSRQIIKSQQDKQTFTQSLIQELIRDLPKMMFGLLPLFALLLKVTYWRRKRLYVEHFVFALHSHAFLFTLLILMFLAHKAGVSSGVARTASAIILPVYLLAAQRRVYKQGWPKTVAKFVWLALNYILLLAAAFTLTAIAAFLLA